MSNRNICLALYHGDDEAELFLTVDSRTGRIVSGETDWSNLRGPHPFAWFKWARFSQSQPSYKFIRFARSWLKDQEKVLRPSIMEALQNKDGIARLRITIEKTV